MNLRPRRIIFSLALAGVLSMSRLAFADLGPIRVLSGDSENFSAEIPFVDGLPGNAVSISLADRNRYPQLSPYSPSAESLRFTLEKAPDGTPVGVLISGPARMQENELRFAVAMSWPSGGDVREYLVDNRLGPSHHRAPAPAHGEGKKPAPLPHSFPGWASLGLGELKIKSLPGQPFSAETEVFGNRAQIRQNLSVRILPDAGDAAVSPDMLRVVASMRHALVRAPSGAYVLQLSSDEPVTVGALGFRLDVQLGRAHMARRYGLEIRDGEFAVSSHTVAGRASGFKVLRVLPGDSLSAIASRMRHDGVRTRDVIQRLYQENPQAFIAGDIDLLIADARLKYPEAWSVGTAQPALSAQPARVATRIPPPAPKISAEERAAIQAQKAALRSRLQQQDAMLAQAQQLSKSLERKLQDLSASQASQAVPAVAAPQPAGPTPQWLIEARKPEVLGSAAALAAAAATALALRRRRRRQSESDATLPPVAAPTIEGLRQWLRYDPQRQDLRFRLLQLLASQDDAQGFVSEAERAREYMEADGPMWHAVEQMGREVAPGHPWSPAAPSAAPTPLSETGATQAPPRFSEPSAGVQPRNRALAADAPSSDVRPERPLTEAGEWDSFAPAEFVFSDLEREPEVEPPPEPDKMELAKLYMEMGDTETANELMRAAAAVSR
jgi:Tfp pilus assembly protein FimV